MILLRLPRDSPLEGEEMVSPLKRVEDTTLEVTSETLVMSNDQDYLWVVPGQVGIGRIGSNIFFSNQGFDF